MLKPWRVSDLRLFGEVLTLVPRDYSEIFANILKYSTVQSKELQESDAETMRVSDLRLFGEVITLLPYSYSEVLPEFLKWFKARSFKKVTPKRGDTITYRIFLER